MTNNKIKCPICGSHTINHFYGFKSGIFDNSSLYTEIILVKCSKCSHIFNDISIKDLKNLKKYYNNEYSISNLHSESKTGDMPGTTNSNTNKRHSQLFELISPYIDSNLDFKVLDIGCAAGGFLSYLRDTGFRNENLFGLELSKNYAECARSNGFNIQVKDIESVKFNKTKFDIINMDQVLEHCFDINSVFNKVHSILNKDGIFCIGVPNSLEYKNFPFFPFYWFLLKEHLQHFDIYHLNLLAEKNGFTLVNYSYTESEMMSEKMILPNLTAVFKKSEKKKRIDYKDAQLSYLRDQLNKYIRQEIGSNKSVY